MHNIIIAKIDRDYEASVALFTEYAEWLNIDLCFQNFDDELLQLKEVYGAPYGIILLAKKEEKYIGCVAVRNKGENIAELKRMFVKANNRNEGLGEALLSKAINFAIEVGYKKIRLDTLANMTSAINLYTKFGFYEIEPYYFNPEPNAVFFEKLL